MVAALILLGEDLTPASKDRLMPLKEQQCRHVCHCPLVLLEGLCLRSEPSEPSGKRRYMASPAESSGEERAGDPCTSGSAYA